MPASSITQFQGLFLDGPDRGCHHSGWMYYNDTAKMLRTDWLFGPSCPIGETESIRMKIDVNDGHAKHIRNYIMPAPNATFECNFIPLPYWWAADYLRKPTTTRNGTAVVELLSGGSPVPCDVFRSTDVFIAGYVLTYVSQKYNTIVRMKVVQGYGEDYFVDFDSGRGLTPAAVEPHRFDVLPSVRCA